MATIEWGFPMDDQEIISILQNLVHDRSKINIDKNKLTLFIKKIIDKKMDINIRMRFNGIQLGILRQSFFDIAKEMGIEESEFKGYLNAALKKISDTIQKKLEGQEIEGEIEDLIIKNYYTDAIELSYNLKKNPLFSNLTSFNIVKQKSKFKDKEIEYFVMNFEYDPNSKIADTEIHNDFITEKHFVVALSKSQLSHLYKIIKAVIENESK